ncbi:MAG: pro-sigmaK processing inhibitor BofA family protein [Clostridia bacterium]|nr:pro-sigmaK processing inhibitor BofA family protein [Clostridia bacterium]
MLLQRGDPVQIPWELILSFAIGLALLCLIGHLLLVPMRFMWRMVAGGVMGALALALVNLIGGMVGFRVQINPFTAMAVGFLGLPGAALVVALQLLL